jgi:omega-hydroxy-beta-dihydromenaquinone-9 sulfotransferase
MSAPDRPMIIVTAGRSGSTILHRILSRHPSAAWIGNYDDRFPNWALLSKVIRALRELPVHVPVRHRPLECWQFWEYQCPGFSVPKRDMLASDVTPEVRLRLQKALRARTTRRRDRILLKITGWPRIRFLREIFPDALFLHLVRDGRAMALSTIRQPWWVPGEGPEGWPWGPLSSPYRERWEASGKSQPELAALAWQMTLDGIEECKHEVNSDQLLEIRYEDLCRDPEVVVGEILRFFDLGWAKRIASFLHVNPLVDRTDSSSPDWAVLEAMLAKYLARYGYV